MGALAGAGLPQNNVISMQSVDWYTLETNVKKLVLEFIEPTVKLAKNQELEMQSVTEQQKKVITKLDELEFVMQKTHKRAVSLDMLDKQIKEIVSLELRV